MANELYQLQTSVHYRSNVQTTSFYFLLTGTIVDDPFKTARAINVTYTIDTNWLFFFANLWSDSAELRSVRTRRIWPTRGPSCWRTFPPGGIPGGLGGNVDTNFSTFPLRWHSQDDRTGKNQVRIGPITEEFLANGYPLSTLIFRATAFVGVHLAAQTTLPGVTSVGAIKGVAASGEAITSFDYGTGCGRQITRRVRQ